MAHSNQVPTPPQMVLHKIKQQWFNVPNFSPKMVGQDRESWYPYENIFTHGSWEGFGCLRLSTSGILHVTKYLIFEIYCRYNGRRWYLPTQIYLPWGQYFLLSGEGEVSH